MRSDWIWTLLILADTVLREIKQSRCYKVQITDAEVKESIRYKLINILLYNNCTGIVIALDKWFNTHTYNTMT